MHRSETIGGESSIISRVSDRKGKNNIYILFIIILAHFYTFLPTHLHFFRIAVIIYNEIERRYTYVKYN